MKPFDDPTLLTPTEIADLRQDKKDALARLRELASASTMRATVLEGRAAAVEEQARQAKA